MFGLGITNYTTFNLFLNFEILLKRYLINEKTKEVPFFSRLATSTYRNFIMEEKRGNFYLTMVPSHVPRDRDLINL